MLIKKGIAGVFVAVAMAIFGVFSAAADHHMTTETMTVAESAEMVKPLKVGEKAAMVKVKDMEGKEIELKDVYAKGPTVLVFYRGGWCPYCVKHLAALGKIREQLVGEGYQLVALTPDMPEMIKKDAMEKNFDFTILSDASGEATTAFGLAFRVDDKTIEKYHGYGIDLEKRSGEKHHILPVPAAYVIDKEGKIQFAHWDAEYNKRIDTEKLLAAARDAKMAK